MVLRVFPPAEAVSAVAEGLGYDRVLPTLDYIAGSISRRGDFILRLEDEQREVAGLIDRWASGLPLAQRHRLLGAPIPLRIAKVVDFAQKAVRALAQGRHCSLEDELEEVQRLHGYERLQTLEDLARIATLGRWLARRWPDAVDLETAQVIAETADQKIAAALASRPRVRKGFRSERPTRGKGRHQPRLARRA